VSIVILVGGTSSNGNAEHRYLVNAFLNEFGDQVDAVVTCDPQPSPLITRLKRAFKRGNYRERIARAKWGKGYGPDAHLLSKALFAQSPVDEMPGGEKLHVMSSHNSAECEALMQKLQPEVIVVYGTAILKEHIFSKAKQVCLNMHTGLSPHYRGDSTLFWPVYHNDPDHLGVTVHKLVADVDGGDIVYTGKVNYEKGDGEAELFAKGVQVGTALYLQAVKDVFDGSIVYHPQDLSIGREFRWIHRTVEAEKTVLDNLERWARLES